MDAFAPPSEVLHRRIAIIEEAMPKMMDYIRREGPRKVYDCINRIYEKSGKRGRHPETLHQTHACLPAGPAVPIYEA